MKEIGVDNPTGVELKPPMTHKMASDMNRDIAVDYDLPKAKNQAKKALLKSDDSYGNQTDKSFYQAISSQSGFRTQNPAFEINQSQNNGFGNNQGSYST